MKKISLLLAAALTLTVTGCASTTNPSATSTPTSTATNSSTPTPNPSSIDIDVTKLVDDPAARTTLIAALEASALQAKATGLVIASTDTTNGVTLVYDPTRAVGKNAASSSANQNVAILLPKEYVASWKAPLALGDLYALIAQKTTKVASPAGASKWVIVLGNNTSLIVTSKNGTIVSLKSQASKDAPLAESLFTYSIDAVASKILDTAVPVEQAPAPTSQK